MQKFKIGTLVWLLSGSPKMTVSFFIETEKKYSCTWFDGKEFQERKFHEDTLTDKDPNYIPPEAFKTT